MRKNLLKAVILTTFHSAEYSIVRSYLQKQREVTISQGNVYSYGSFSAPHIAWEILLGQIGMGNIESAIEVERAINSFHPDIILSLGLALGFKNVQVGDVLAVTEAYHYERGLATESGFKPRSEANRSTYRMLQRARAETRSNDWQKMLHAYNGETLGAKAYIGPLASGEKEVITLSGFTQFLDNYYGDTLAIDTSSSGFLDATQAVAHVEALIVRGIAGTLSDHGSSISVQKAAYHATAFAFTVLSKLSASQFQYADPRFEPAQLARSNAPAFFHNERNITVYPAASIGGTSSKAEQLFNQGNAYFQQYEYKNAVKSYTESLRLDKKNAKALNNKGLAHFHLGEYGKALEAYTQAIKYAPKYAEAYSNQAAVFYKQGDYDKAQASYQHALNLYSIMSQALDEAQKGTLAKCQASALTGLGDVPCSRGYYRIAKSHYTHALRLEPSRASAHVGRGNCNVQQERFVDALADYKQAIKHNPDNATAYKGQGQAYQSLKQWRKALEAYEKALLLKSNGTAEIQCARGMAYFALGEYENALEAFKDFHEMHPATLLSYQCLIATLEKLQSYEEALKFCTEASQRFPGNEWIALYQQRAHLELDQFHQHIEEQDTTLLPRIEVFDFSYEKSKQRILPSNESAFAQTSQYIRKNAGPRWKVFISYDDRDDKWRELLHKHLGTMEREGIIEVWDKSKIEKGTRHDMPLQEALRTARIAITLVSRDYLDSDLATQRELEALLSRADSDGLVLIPLIVGHCLFDTSRLKKFQTANGLKKPLSRMTTAERDEAIVDLAKDIRRRVIGA